MDELINRLLAEPGSAGIIIAGMYWVLYNPLRRISDALGKINDDLTELTRIIKLELEEKKRATSG